MKTKRRTNYLSFFFSYGGEKLEAVVAEREAKGMKEIAIQEKDLTLQWRGNTGKLVKVRLKNTRAMEMWYNKQIAMEMWYNKQITEENIQEITTLNIIKNGKSLALEVYPEKSIYVKPNLGKINVPVFFIKTPINRGVFEEIFGETLKG